MDSIKQLNELYDQLMILDECVGDKNEEKEYIELLNLGEILKESANNNDIYGDAKDIIEDTIAAYYDNVKILYGLVAVSLTPYIINHVIEIKQ